jgi:hypothetical protein
MYTSMIGLAVSAFLGTATPVWQTDYREAKAQAARDQKPMVVVLCTCTGEAAWNGITTEGSLGNETLKILRESYVCVYVDTDSDKGRRLAVDFDLKSGPSLIISDKTGEVQAYRQDGTLSAGKLTEVLRLYANPDRVVSQTDSNRVVAPASYFTPPVLQQCLT